MNKSDWIGTVIRDMAELPDRSSPEDQPEMMLVTADELRLILGRSKPHSNHLNVVMEALRNLAADVAQVARESFYNEHSGDGFEESFEAEDPAGFKVWKAAMDALAASQEQSS